LYYNYWYDQYLRKKIYKDVQAIVEKYKNFSEDDIKQKIITYLRSDEDYKPYKVQCRYDVPTGKITILVT
jgi:hypothetical protein